MKSSISKYGFFRVGIVSPELKVADISFNVRKLIEAIDSCGKELPSVLLFPELCISGYTCGDLFFQQTLLKNVEEALFELCSVSKEKNVCIIAGAPLVSKGRLFNTAVLFSDGAIRGVIPKTYLCNSNEYYEERWFSSEFDRQSDTISIGGTDVPFGADILFRDTISDALIGIEICEDLWSLIPPSSYQAAAGANILFNLSASNEYLGKSEYRDNLVLSQSARCLAAYCYASSGPGESTTDLLYSGKCLIAENGILLSESEKFQFSNQMIMADIDLEKIQSERLHNNSFAASRADKKFRIIDICLPLSEDSKLIRKLNPSPFVPANPKERDAKCRDIFGIQSTALAKRIKHIKTKDVVIGISGGLDSTLALLVSIKAFEKLGLDLSGIHAITMPGPGTSKRTRNNAVELAGLLKTDLLEIDITPAVRQHFKDLNYDYEKRDVVFENAQARERTQILMDKANQLNGIVIGTGDMSELALGWATYNGDHISMYGVNAGVPKTLVKYIIEWCAQELYKGEISAVLHDICDTPISPELLPADKSGEIAQKTEEVVGPYILHDFFLYNFMRFGYSPEKILFLAQLSFKNQYTKNEINKWLDIFIKRFFSQQFKRSCLPDGIKVGTVSLSPRGEWRMPSDAEAELWLDFQDK